MPISKETILEEIRRLAKQNGGKPPGRLALTTETGIKESAWRGVYWAKWNDAIIEAGLEPNTLKQAYTKEELLEVLAQVTKNLGHVPTYPELRLLARQQAGIPADTTFNRLGSKAQQIEQLLAYCRVHPNHSDILPICEKAAALGASPEFESTVEPDSSDGFVYLFKSGRRYKFGFTNDTQRRIRELAYQTSEPINKVHEIRTDDPSGIEAYWKKRFANKCVHNEWFELSTKDVAAFRRRKNFM